LIICTPIITTQTVDKDDLYISNSLEKLCKWLDINGFKGYDPYDIKDSPFLLKVIRTGNRNRFFALFREAVFEVFYTFPRISRKLLAVKPVFNAKAMGLFASSYLDLYVIYKNDIFLEKAEDCFQWLKDNKIKIHQGIGWGYPFNWQAKELIPAGTPNGIVTTVAGEAFWKHYKLTGNQESLEQCLLICSFLCALPIDRTGNEKICFSYTPVFQNHVHNLNLFVAEMLIKTGIESNNPKWVTLGNLAVNYTLSDQHPDGSFDYNGPPEKPNNHIDNYHTGFILRMLHSIWKLTGRDDVFKAMKNCYQHYITHFFEADRIPKLMPHKKYRIDIHSCAESVHCLSELSETFPEGNKIAGNVLHWTIQNLQDKSGYFYYGIMKSRFTGFPFKSKIPYIRWGQAWMLKALSSYLMARKNKS
jgi:hypothetical protein